MIARLKKLRDVLSQRNVDSALISSWENICYLTNYTGFSHEEREAFLYITNQKEFLITDARYSKQTNHYIPHMTTLVKNFENPTKIILERLVRENNILQTGYEDTDLRVSEFKAFRKISKKFTPINLTHLRETKEEKEIEIIKKACNLTEEALQETLPYITEGIRENELAYIVENYFRLHGASPAFRSIVAFGANAAIPHHLTSDKRLQKNQCILFDIGANVGNYCSDMTRTIMFGKDSPLFRNAYETVLNAQKAASEYIIKNTPSHVPLYRVDSIARQYLTNKGYASIPHALGHGVGLAIHEAPSLSPHTKDTLKNGMVFSLEPGIYVPGHFGIRIEDLFVFYKNKLIPLTHRPNEEIIQLSTKE